MKRLALLALLAACGDEADSAASLEIQITITENGGTLAVIDGSSECARRWHPHESGVCTEAGDDTADCPGLKASFEDCVYGVELEGVSGVQFARGSWAGNALGGTLLIKGCGEPVRIPLPTTVPTVPAGVMRVDASTSTEVMWSSDSSVATVLLTTGYDTGTTQCRADASTGQFTLPIYGTLVTLQAESPATVVETRLGPAYVRAAATIEVPQ